MFQMVLEMEIKVMKIGWINYFFIENAGCTFKCSCYVLREDNGNIFLILLFWNLIFSMEKAEALHKCKMLW